MPSGWLVRGGLAERKALHLLQRGPPRARRFAGTPRGRFLGQDPGAVALEGAVPAVARARNHGNGEGRQG